MLRAACFVAQAASGQRCIALRSPWSSLRMGVCMNRRTYVHADGRTDGRTDGRMDGQTYLQKYRHSTRSEASDCWGVDSLGAQPTPGSGLSTPDFTCFFPVPRTMDCTAPYPLFLSSSLVQPHRRPRAHIASQRPRAYAHAVACYVLVTEYSTVHESVSTLSCFCLVSSPQFSAKLHMRGACHGQTDGRMGGQTYLQKYRRSSRSEASDCWGVDPLGAQPTPGSASGLSTS